MENRLLLSESNYLNRCLIASFGEYSIILGPTQLMTILIFSRSLGP